MKMPFVIREKTEGFYIAAKEDYTMKHESDLRGARRFKKRSAAKNLLAHWNKLVDTSKLRIEAMSEEEKYQNWAYAEFSKREYEIIEI